MNLTRSYGNSLAISTLSTLLWPPVTKQRRAATVDGSEILRSPVELGSLSHLFMTGFKNIRFLAGFLVAINSIWVFPKIVVPQNGW